MFKLLNKLEQLDTETKKIKSFLPRKVVEPTHLKIDAYVTAYGLHDSPVTVHEFVRRLHDACKPGGALQPRQCAAVRGIVQMRFGETQTEVAAALQDYFLKHSTVLKPQHARLLKLR
jgi:hypothetical protein